MLSTFLVICFIVVIYSIQCGICAGYHIYNKTPFPSTFKRFFMLTFFPYVLYYVVRGKQKELK